METRHFRSSRVLLLTGLIMAGALSVALPQGFGQEFGEFEGQVCGSFFRGKAVALLVDPSLVAGIRAGLNQFERDLCAERYAVYEIRYGFHTPDEVRGVLAALYTQTNRRLAGAILIGNLPHAYQFVVLSPNPSFRSTPEEVISFQNGFFGHNIATALAAGASFGEAILRHVNVPLVPPWDQDREFHYATPVILGDPTLRLRP